MLRDHFDVFMLVASVQFVLDAEVREVNRLIEVRQVVFVRPRFGLAGVPIGSPVAVRPATIRLLQPFLILALELVIEHDAADVGAFLAKPFRLAQVRAIKLDVVRQFPRPADAGVEALLAAIVTIAAVAFQKVVTALGECYGALAAVQFNELRQALVTQIAEVSLANADRFVVPIAEIALGRHPKRADGRQGSTVIAVQFVPMIAIEHDLAFRTVRQFESIEKHVSWINLSFAGIAIALATVTVTIIQIAAVTIQIRLMPDLYPRHLHLSGVVIAIARIKVEH